MRPMSGELAIRLRGAVKRYGPITAVDGFDLDVPYGTCVGLLGPNGAGKSTTMRLLTAQAIADEGELEVLGFQLPEESKAARAQCGVVPQLDNLDTTLTVEQNLLVFTHLYRIGRAERREAIERALRGRGGGRGVGPAGEAGRGGGGRGGGGLPHAGNRDERLRPGRRRRRGPGARGRAAARQPRGRLRAADRRGDRLMASAARA